MEQLVDFVNIKGAMGLIKKSNHFLAPIFEAVTNSFEAINSKKFTNNETPFIQINLYFTGLFQDERFFEKVEVIDNGIGFDNASYNRYRTLLDKTKGFNNRGSGRLQYFHRFDSIKIDSNFESDGILFNRKFFSDENRLVYNADDVNRLDGEEHTGTTVSMKGLKQSISTKSAFDSLSIDELQNEIQNKFLLKLYLEKKKNLKSPAIKICYFKNEILEESKEIDSSNIPSPESDDVEIRVSYLKVSGDIAKKIEWIPTKNSELLKLAHWKLPEAQLAKNGIYLCSKDIAIQSLPLLKIKKNEAVSGFRHLTAVYGEVLDRPEFVSDSVDRFLLPSQRDLEKEAADNDMFFNPDEEHLFIEEIEKEIKKALPNIYTELNTLKAEQDKRVEYFAETHGISLEIAQSTSIDLSDTDEKILEKIYKRQAEESSKRNFKIQKLYDSLIDLNPISQSYKDDLESKGKELLELIPHQNKEELSRYVIRREMVTKLLELILDNQLNYQNRVVQKGERTEKEGLIHDLIFKRKESTIDGLNDLWILNEEFLHFSGYSDTELSKISFPDGTMLLSSTKSEDELYKEFKIDKRKLSRPDVFLYPEEGSCVLIEFKAHDVDLSDHLNQLTRYCNLIANLSTKRIERFYCYLVGETIDRIDLPGEFARTVYNDFVKPNQPIKSVKPGQDDITIAHIYQEVVQLSNISKRAASRNKSFADKLEIRLDRVPLSK
jgi:hypothetical protein